MKYKCKKCLTKDPDLFYRSNRTICKKCVVKNPNYKKSKVITLTNLFRSCICCGEEKDTSFFYGIKKRCVECLKDNVNLDKLENYFEKGHFEMMKKYMVNLIIEIKEKFKK